MDVMLDERAPDERPSDEGMVPERVRRDRSTHGDIADFLASLGLNTRLREHGVKVEQLDALVAQAIDDPCHKTNAVPVTSEDMRKLYQEVL